LILISLEIFQYCLKFNSPFQIESNFPSDQVLLKLQQFKSLFQSETRLIINQSNFDLLDFIASKLNHPFLTKLCNEISDVHHQIFSLSFDFLSFIPRILSQHLDNFSLIVNDFEF
jgi:hypothetical protein